MYYYYQMNTDKQNIDFIELVSSYLSDELNSADVSILENLIKSNDNNKKIFLAHKNAFVSSNITKYNNNIVVKNEFNKLQTKLGINTDDSYKKKTNYKLLFSIAAAVIIIITGIFSINYFANSRTLIYTASNSIIEQTTPDGSVIELNRNTSLEYKKTKKCRTVKLNGSAFFNVKRNTKLPFIIETQNIKVSVLGTSFLVESRKNEDFINIVVTTGKVSVKNTDKEIILLAGERGVFSKKENSLYKLKNTDTNYLSWKTKQLTFNNSDLNEVANTLSKTYNVSIKVDENIDLSDRKLTAKFNNKSFESVLKIIKETLDIDTKENNNEIIIVSNK